MIKKTLAALMAMIILGGLAYYSGVLYSEKNQERIREEEQAHLRVSGTIFMETQLSKLEVLNNRERELQETRDQARQEVSSQGDMILSETKDYLYYLIEEFGYVNIYLADKKTIYEYTDITLDMLPTKLQSEILEGKGLSSEGELYDFLENYSS